MIASEAGLPRYVSLRALRPLPAPGPPRRPWLTPSRKRPRPALILRRLRMVMLVARLNLLDVLIILHQLAMTRNRKSTIERHRQSELVNKRFRSAKFSHQRRNIPFVKYGGVKFLEAAHVKDVLSVFTA
jgi:hypothetical protein